MTPSRAGSKIGEVEIAIFANDKMKAAAEKGQLN